MKILLFILLQFISHIATATNSNDVSQLDNKIIYCPEKIECYEEGTCEFFGEDKNYFRHLLMPNKVIMGTYAFLKAEFRTPGSSNPALWPDEQYSYNTCHYKNSWDEVIQLVIFNGINIEPLIENWTNWKGTSESHKKECYALSPNTCPMKKHSGIMFEKMMRNQENQIYRYDDGSKKPVEIDLKVNLMGNTNPSHTVWYVNHDTLRKYCKNLNRCEIPVAAALKTEKIYHAGSIFIDVENDDEIVEISPLNGKSHLLMKSNPFIPNTIVFEYIG